VPLPRHGVFLLDDTSAGHWCGMVPGPDDARRDTVRRIHCRFPHLEALQRGTLGGDHAVPIRGRDHDPGEPSMPDLTSHARTAAALPLIDRVAPDTANTFLKVPDIAGESRHASHEEEIELFGVEWGFDATDSATAGRGRRRRAAQASDVVVTLATDASVPHLVQAMLRGRAFDEVVISWVVLGDVQFERQQLTLRNVVVSSVRLASAQSLPAVVAAFSYESFVLRYVEQGDDHAAGTEHEVEFDLFANA